MSGSTISTWSTPVPDVPFLFLKLLTVNFCPTISLPSLIKRESISSRYNLKCSIFLGHEKKAFLEIFNKSRYYKSFVHSNLSIYANQIKNVSNKFLKNDNNKSRLFDVSKSLENMTYLDHWMQSIK